MLSNSPLHVKIKANLINAVLDGEHHLLLLDGQRHEPDERVVAHQLRQRLVQLLVLPGERVIGYPVGEIPQIL